MEEYLEQLWNISFLSLRELQAKFQVDNSLLRTEGDLQAHLLCAIENKRNENIQFEVHSEITWYENEYHRQFRRDISLFNTENVLDENLIAPLNKGFRHQGPILGIEVKFIRSTDTQNQILNKTWEDLDRILNYSHLYYSSDRNKGFPKWFIIVIGCSFNSDIEFVRHSFLRNIGRFIDELEIRDLRWRNMHRTIVLPIFLSVDEVTLLWD